MAIGNAWRQSPREDATGSHFGVFPGSSGGYHYTSAVADFCAIGEFKARVSPKISLGSVSSSLSKRISNKEDPHSSTRTALNRKGSSFKSRSATHRGNVVSKRPARIGIIERGARVE